MGRGGLSTASFVARCGIWKTGKKGIQGVPTSGHVRHVREEMRRSGGVTRFMDEDYYAAAKERLDRHKKQARLFDPVDWLAGVGGIKNVEQERLL